ncbi:MAG: hypothetical protein NTV40_02250 [Solirubrobacterales bacterium]|nr:hypothetical protein [Solirubrobacterales bacterium]
MEPITIIHGAVSVLDRADVDTDQIIPKQFLKRVERTGFGEFLFYDWAKEPGWDLPRNPILEVNVGCHPDHEVGGHLLSQLFLRRMFEELQNQHLR